MILILDTDHLTLIQRHTEPAHSRLRTRIDSLPEEDVCTTIISFEEQMRGWLSAIARSKSTAQEIAAYQRLYDLVAFFSNIPVLPYDDHAASQFSDLRQLRLRVSSMDLKIAAIALSLDALLLSRNLRDFRRVPSLSVEDWTV